MDASKVLYKAGTFYTVINSDLDKAPRVVRRAATAIFSGAGCTVYQLYRFTAWRFGAKVSLVKSLQILAHLSKKDAPVNSVRCTYDKLFGITEEAQKRATNFFNMCHAHRGV